MSKQVWSAELTDANKSSSMNLLEELPNDAKNIKSKIESFIEEIGEGKPLSGDGYTAVKTKFELYIDSLKMVEQICNDLTLSVKAANGLLLGYMAGYTFLNDEEKNSIRIQFNNAYNIWQNAKDATVPDDDGNNIPQYSDEVILSFEAEYNRLKKLLEKLEGLSKADENAYSNISNIEGKVSSILSKIDDIPNNSFSLKFEYFNSHSYIKGNLKNGRNYYGFYQKDTTHWENAAADNTCSIFAVTTAISTAFGNDAFNPETGDIRITPYTIKALTGAYDSGNGTTNIPVKAGDLYGLDYTNDLNPGDPEDIKKINAILVNGGAVVCNDDFHFKTIVDYDEKTGMYTIWDPMNLERKDETMFKNNSGGTFSCFTFAPRGQNINEILENSGLDSIDVYTSNFKNAHPDYDPDIDTILNGSINELTKIGNEYN